MAFERLQVILELITGQYKREARQAADATSQISRSAQTASGGMSSLTGSLTSFARVAGTAFAAAGIADFARDSIQAASDLEESMNAVNVVFGTAADKIHEFGETSVDAVGLAAVNVNKSATVLGSALINAGLSADEAADKTIELTTRASDMASVFNTTVPDALGAMQAALRGESDPIERFGVSLTAAAVEAEAAVLGYQKVGGEFDATAKAAARLSLIMQQTDRVAGDFTNTGDSTANTLKKMNERFTEMKGRIGTALMPAFKALLDVAEDSAPIFEDVALAVAELFTEMKPLIEGIGHLISAYQGAKDAGEDWSDSTNPLIAGVGEYISHVGPMAVVTGNYTAAAAAAADITEQRLTPSFKEAGEKSGDAAKGIEFMANATKDDLIPALDSVADPVGRVNRGLIDAMSAAQAAGRAFREDLAAVYQQAAISIDKTSKAMAVSLDEIEKRLLENLADQAAFYTNLVALADAGFNDLAQFLRGQGADEVAGATADLVDDFERAASLERAIEQGQRDAERFTDALADALESSKTRLLDVASSLGVDLAAQVEAGFSTIDLVQYLGDALGAPGKLISTPITTGGGSSATQRQHGGWLRAGQISVVGERGPELFVSGASGSIISNRQLMAALGRPNQSRSVQMVFNDLGLRSPVDLQYATLLANHQTFGKF